MQCQGQRREQKLTTKKFVGFHNHSPVLTMFKFMTGPPICGPYLRRLKILRARSIDRIPE